MEVVPRGAVTTDVGTNVGGTLPCDAVWPAPHADATARHATATVMDLQQFNGDVDESRSHVLAQTLGLRIHAH